MAIAKPIDKQILVNETVHRLIGIYAAKQTPKRSIKSCAEEAILEYLARRQAREYVKEAEHDLAT